MRSLRDEILVAGDLLRWLCWLRRGPSRDQSFMRGEGVGESLISASATKLEETMS